MNLKQIINKVKLRNPRTKKKCLICRLPMLVADGQIAKYHKACRVKRHNLKKK